MNDPKRGLLSTLLGAVARRNLEARDQHDVHSLRIVGSVMPENVHFTPAAGQGDEIRMFHQQTATVGDVNEKGAEGLRVEQLPDVIRFHAFNNTEIPASRKRNGPRSAGFQPAVSPTSSRQAAPAWSHLRIGNPRHSRADCRSGRKRTQRTQKNKKQGFSLRSLRSFAAISEFCNCLSRLEACATQKHPGNQP